MMIIFVKHYYDVGSYWLLILTMIRSWLSKATVNLHATFYVPLFMVDIGHSGVYGLTSKCRLVFSSPHHLDRVSFAANNLHSHTCRPCW